MKIYIVNYETDVIRDNFHWAFSNEEDAQKLAKDLIQGLKEREEIETTSTRIVVRNSSII